MEENSFRQWKYKVFGGKERWCHAWTGEDGVKLHMRAERFLGETQEGEEVKR